MITIIILCEWWKENFLFRIVNLLFSLLFLIFFHLFYNLDESEKSYHVWMWSNWQTTATFKKKNAREIIRSIEKKGRKKDKKNTKTTTTTIIIWLSNLLPICFLYLSCNKLNDYHHHHHHYIRSVNKVFS